ncbi:serine/threonine/dual specificity protein kinase, catalytic domain-containing protein [Artemisia annua]|uniref:non-specific serine/threonine protein kinase n=1 Tax=Artemisia annua TaxID=35608 RepID=A0A2U1P1T9_ARTAN|nr:serine/threonine/dual specificity protein kinase, catalytic domain-containing protein [Artemisia annua]
MIDVSNMLVIIVWAALLSVGFASIETSLLPSDEVDALKLIGSKLGKNWDFKQDPCVDWVRSNPNSTYDDTLRCNCNRTICHVTSISLKGQSLQGTLPPELANLPYLQNLDLTRNFLSSTIPPEWGSMRQIQNISLIANRINGSIPKELGNISTLTSLVVEGNIMSGIIPEELGNLQSIERLLLNSNYFTGRLPESFANLTTMKDFRICGNNFTGKIPDFIGRWKRLKTLKIQASGLEGPIPSTITLLSDLSDLRISDLRGPDMYFPPFSNTTSFKNLILRSCNLIGNLPISLAPNALKVLDLSFNKLNGTIPDAFANLKNTDNMYLTGNLLSGIVPDWMLKGDSIDLSYNKFTYESLRESRCQMDKTDLSFNKLNGTIPDAFANLKNTDNMYLTGNLLSGIVPDWMLKGDSIDLSYNKFTYESLRESRCQMDKTNLFASFSTDNTSKEVSCLGNDVCKANSTSLYINCGGSQLSVGDKSYEGDLNAGGPSHFSSTDNRWGFSMTGHYLDDDQNDDSYIVTTTSGAPVNTSELYSTARSSALSLTYYSFCMLNGSYNVSLHFAEIVFTDDKTYSSLGRRVFDIYIQGVLVEKDFDISDRAGGARKVVVTTYTVNVTTTLEIRLYWAGKGTISTPIRGVYGPLISAISVDPNFQVPQKDGNEHKNENGVSVVTVVGIVVGAIGLIVLILGALWWLGYFHHGDTNDIELNGVTGTFTLRQIKAATNDFDIANKIGEGGFGSVYKGVLPDGTLIAVKQLSSKSRQGNREFLNELGMISALQHPHLVKLHGCCIEGNQLLLAYEYMENNSLARALFGPERWQLELDWPTRYRICIGIARGLAFLHEESRLKIVHRDIKATNVLLDKNLDAKISDFGLAKLDEEDNTHISTRIAGTYGYMAPEYALRGYLTDKADVYSYGIVLLEIVSGMANTVDRTKENHFILLDRAIALKSTGDLMELVDPRLDSEYDVQEVMVVTNLALLCTTISPSERPTMSSVVSMLEGRILPQDFVVEHNVSITQMERDKKINQLEAMNESEIMNMSVPYTDTSESVVDLYPDDLYDEYLHKRDQDGKKLSPNA